MNKTIKTVINLLPIFLVPLILERKKFKQHPDVQKATKTTVHTSKAVVHHTQHAATSVKDAIVSGSSHVKNTVQRKKRRHDYNKAIKKQNEILQYNRPENVRARGKSLAKANRKEIDTMAKNLQKHITQRHKEEEKNVEKRQKHMIKNMKKMQKYEEKVGLTPGHLDKKAEKRGEKLEQQNKKTVDKMNQKLKKHIEQRHKKEDKQKKEREKALKQQMKKIQKHHAISQKSKAEATSSSTVNQDEKQSVTSSALGQRDTPTTAQSPLHTQHYQKMAQHVENSDTLRQNQQLNDISQASLDKQKR
ncbi:hypothetical protein [Staphylococcus lutrae]|uniref:Uncharacterized protein n=1 Tax=Staphylococcus lutrae TaxID=155085 RepID=A0AAC9RRW0_9STAP|nr:hypothetical protein B5P37_07840 [Staphylococcus lutrae]PNZ39468.1 hypothetical protein CD134_01170 [Staphylococcus lutrae]